MVERLAQRGQDPKRESWLRHLAEDGDVLAMLELARLLESTARAEEAKGWLRRAAERGNSEAMLELGGLLERTGRGHEAARLHRFGIEPGGRTADAW